jgi:hypothetical protein
MHDVVVVHRRGAPIGKWPVVARGEVAGGRLDRFLSDMM